MGLEEVLQPLPAHTSPDAQVVGAWVALLVVGIVFAFVINTLFGHPTYHAIQHQPLLHLKAEQARQAQHKRGVSGGDGGNCGNGEKCMQAFHKTRDLPEGVVLHMLSFLNVHEKLQLAQADKACQRITDHKELWGHLFQICARDASRDVDKQAQLQIQQLCENLSCTKRGFFEAVHRLAPIITASYRRSNEEEAYVIVHRRVYHLTSFVNDHPGGGLIIRSYNGKDATKMYDRALHSQVAKQHARNFVVWDPAKYIGAESGVPTFAKDAVVSGADGWLEPRNYHLQP